MTETQRVNLLDVLTSDRTLPEGCDRWAIRSVHPDLRSSRGYRWPWPGQWADAPGPIIAAHTGECPSEPGDGICVATTWAGMRSGGIPARTLLLCGFADADVLGCSDDKLRLSRACVVDVVDGERLLRQRGSGADLSGADLSGANLTRADLTRADLYGADLTRANLYGADLTRADLSGAYLYGADLTRANLYGADLTRADLTGAYLTRANLSGEYLTRALYDRWTRWPTGYDPATRSAILVGES